MKPSALLAAAFLLCSFTARGQTTAAAILRKTYARAHDGTFVVKPGVKIKVIDGSNVEACVLIISGPISEQELIKTFETAVPAKIRGSKKQDLEECAGGCEQFIDYENVSFTSGVIQNKQTSNPDALIVFKRKECEPAAEAARKIPFSITKLAP